MGIGTSISTGTTSPGRVPGPASAAAEQVADSCRCPADCATAPVHRRRARPRQPSRQNRNNIESQRIDGKPPARAFKRRTLRHAERTPGHKHVHRQSPKTALTRARAATAAVSARMIRGPSEIGNGERLGARASALLVGEAALGPDQHGHAGRARSPAQRLDRARRRSALSSQKMSGRARIPACRARRELARGSAISGTRRMPHCSAASIALRPHALEVDALGDRVARQHGMSLRRAHLGRLLHHVVEPRALERREEIVEVGPALLRAHLLDRLEHAASRLPASARRARHSPSRPLKTRICVAGREAQHVDEIVRLRRRARDAGAGRERRLDEQAFGREIVDWHRPSISDSPAVVQRRCRSPRTLFGLAATTGRSPDCGEEAADDGPHRHAQTPTGTRRCPRSPTRAPGNWVDRLRPRGDARPTCGSRAWTGPIGTWLLLFPVLVVAGAGRGLGGHPYPSLVSLALFAIGAFVMRGAGCAYNDYVDRDFDARVDAHREPAHSLGPGDARGGAALRRPPCRSSASSC